MIDCSPDIDSSAQIGGKQPNKIKEKSFKTEGQ